MQGTPFANELIGQAESILQHRFSLLGYEIETGPDIQWRRDYVNSIESGLQYFRRVPYLDRSRCGDHKVVWELNRHQHLVLLAQAYRLSGRREFLSEIQQQLESWWAQNPYASGMNWTSALEVAFRTLSWIWIYHLAGADLPEPTVLRLLTELYRHGVYLEYNLSVYFSPNTHLLGEAVALHALGAAFPSWPRAASWRKDGAAIVAAQVRSQVRPDGSHFEQSTAYHLYALDFFLFHAILEPVDENYRSALRRMAVYLQALMDPQGWIPLMGDDDGGRLFHPYGPRRRFGAATLVTCAAFLGHHSSEWEPEDAFEQAFWWLGEQALNVRLCDAGKYEQPSLFGDAGVVVLAHANPHIVADTRGFGYGSAGHSHAHALQVVCRHRGEDILIDPGTFTYVGDPKWRDQFRGTAFHNTLQIDGMDQATPQGPFRWSDKPKSKVDDWTVNERFAFARARCEYRGFRHQRQFLWLEAEQALAILDTVDGPSEQECSLEQRWHVGGAAESLPSGNGYRIGTNVVLLVAEPEFAELLEDGWQSDVPGQKIRKPVVRVKRMQTLPAVWASMIWFRPSPPLQLTLTVRDEIEMRLHPGPMIRFSTSDGPPVIS